MSTETLDFSDLKIVQSLGDSTYPVYLAHSEGNSQHYALKVFPYKKNRISNAYLNEVRFAGFDHANLIKVIHSNNKQKSCVKEEESSPLSSSWSSLSAISPT
jgi:hypothetical protein